jgi:hypothetical protein
VVKFSSEGSVCNFGSVCKLILRYAKSTLQDISTSATNKKWVDWIATVVWERKGDAKIPHMHVNNNHSMSPASI